MADRDELEEFTKTKRVRLSSEASLDQNVSSSGDSDKSEPQADSSLRLNATREGINIEKLSSGTTSREQHVGHVGQERRESEDFPTCFSVEDDLDNIDEHHYQPVAGTKSSRTYKYPQNTISRQSLCPPFCFCSCLLNDHIGIPQIHPKLVFSAEKLLFSMC